MGKMMWIWTETDNESDNIQETNEDVQETLTNADLDDLDGGSSQSDYQPCADAESKLEDLDGLVGLGSSGKPPKKGYQPDANVESKGMLNIDEQDGTEIRSGSKTKQGLEGCKEVKKIQSQMPSTVEHEDMDQGQKRKVAQNKMYEYLFLNGFSNFLTVGAHYFQY